MKKMLSLLLTLLLLCAALPVTAQENLLDVDELLAFCDTILADALKQDPVSAEAAEDGGYVFSFDEYAVYSPDAALTEKSTVTGVELSNSDALLADLRGIAPGHTLDAVLDAYPLDNTYLQGTYTEAVLYMRGLLPGTVNTGRIIRDGSHVLVMEHAVYTVNNDEVEKCCLVYTFDKNTVIAMRIMLGAQHLSLNEAQDELNDLSNLQEANAYRVYTSDAPAALMREDLSFGSFDFLSVTPASALNALGSPVSDTWAVNGEGFMRSMQWDDLQLVFDYDGKKEVSQLILLQVYGENIEGPRNLHLGDSPDSVMARFERAYTDGALLYGDGENAPYGKYQVRDDGSIYILYAAQAEDETVLLALTFVNDELVDMTCTYL